MLQISTYKTIGLYIAILVFSWPLLIVLFDIVVAVLSDYTQICYFFSESFLKKIFNSIRLAATVTTLTTTGSIFLNYLFLKLRNIGLRNGILFILLLLFAIPPIIYLVALTRYEMFSQLPVFWQSALVLTLNLTPLSFTVVWFAISAVDEGSLVTALSHAPPILVVKHIVLPQLFVPLSISSIVVFISVFAQQEVTSFLGYRTYAEDFLSRLITMTDVQEVAIFSLPFLLLAILGVLSLVLIGSKKHLFGILNGDKCEFTFPSSLTSETGVMHKLAAGLIISIPLILCASLLGRIALSDTVKLFSDNFGAIKNSLLTASVVALAGMVLGDIIFQTLRKNYGRLPLLVTALLFLHWLVPPSLIGLGILNINQFLGINSPVYDLLFFYASYFTRILPFAILLTAMLNFVIKPKTDVFITMMHISRFNVFTKLCLPINWRRWLLVWSILAILVLGELSMTILFVPPGVETIIIRIYNLMHYGDYSTVTFLSFIQVQIVAIIIMTACFVQKNKIKRR